jgi:hypothetical protein
VRGVAALDAAARGRGRVCNAAPPLCIACVVTSTLSVECSGVCSCGAAWLGVSVSVLFFDFRERPCAVVSVRCCVAVSLSGCVAMRCAALHWTVAVAVSGSSRAVAVAMRMSWRSGCSAVS